MKHLFKQPFFYTSLLSLLALGLIIASYVFGWTTPTASPPAGNVTLSSSQWTTSGTNIYYNAGNVGIGTSTPAQKLSVAGIIESTSGGFKFPDASIMTSASAVPAGMVAMFSTACPTGWVQVSGFTGKLPMAGASYGSTGNITGTSGTSVLASYINVIFCAKGGILATAPQNLTATGGIGQIVLNWSAPADNGGSAITNYKIYRGTSSGGETYFTTVNNVLTYTDSGLGNYNTYYYKVTAVNGIGETAFSNETSATTIIYCDADGDGHYTKTAVVCPSGRWSATAGDDCDDSCATCYPGSTAYTTSPDGLDQNCDGIVDNVIVISCTPTFGALTYYGYDSNCVWGPGNLYQMTAAPNAPYDSSHCVSSGSACTSYTGGWGNCVLTQQAYNYAVTSGVTCGGYLWSNSRGGTCGCYTQMFECAPMTNCTGVYHYQ